MYYVLEIASFSRILSRYTVSYVGLGIGSGIVDTGRVLPRYLRLRCLHRQGVVWNSSALDLCLITRAADAGFDEHYVNS